MFFCKILVRDIFGGGLSSFGVYIGLYYMFGVRIVMKPGVIERSRGGERGRLTAVLQCLKDMAADSDTTATTRGVCPSQSTNRWCSIQLFDLISLPRLNFG